MQNLVSSKDMRCMSSLSNQENVRLLTDKAFALKTDKLRSLFIWIQLSELEYRAA